MPSWEKPSSFILLKIPAFLSNFMVPSSKTPALILDYTCSLVCFSKTKQSILISLKSCDNNNPEGPPPMIRTWVLIKISSESYFLITKTYIKIILNECFIKNQIEYKN